MKASQEVLVLKNPPADNVGRLRRLGFDPWVRKNPWRRAWEPTPVFLPGESPWTEEPSGLHSTGLPRVRHDQSCLACSSAHWGENAFVAAAIERLEVKGGEDMDQHGGQGSGSLSRGSPHTPAWSQLRTHAHPHTREPQEVTVIKRTWA